jgi:hypothetical protein
MVRETHADEHRCSVSTVFLIYLGAYGARFLGAETMMASIMAASNVPWIISLGDGQHRRPVPANQRPNATKFQISRD